MTSSDSSTRRRKALDLLLDGKIDQASYGKIVCEIETAELGSRDTSDPYRSLSGIPTNVRLLAPVEGDVLAGKYRLVSQLRRDSFVVVSRAVQIRSDGNVIRVVAVKLLPRSYSTMRWNCREFGLHLRKCRRYSIPTSVRCMTSKKMIGSKRSWS